MPDKTAKEPDEWDEPSEDIPDIGGAQPVTPPERPVVK